MRTRRALRGSALVGAAALLFIAGLLAVTQLAQANPPFKTVTICWQGDTLEVPLWKFRAGDFPGATEGACVEEPPPTTTGEEPPPPTTTTEPEPEPPPTTTEPEPTPEPPVSEGPPAPPALVEKGRQHGCPHDFVWDARLGECAVPGLW